MEYVIEMLNITKEFPGIKANDNITVQLKKGEIHALLGENGAGKSTLMNILSGLLEPSEGEVHVKGKLENIDSPSSILFGLYQPDEDALKLTVKLLK